MSRVINLSFTVSCVLNSGGNGSVQCGPTGTNEVWNVSVASVSASSNANEATAKIYAGNLLSQGSFVDGTTWGSTGDSTSNFSSPIHLGQSVWATWTGGDSGAIATLVVSGTRQVP